MSAPARASPSGFVIPLLLFNFTHGFASGHVSCRACLAFST